jgi:MATE family multidrug resistance protein
MYTKKILKFALPLIIANLILAMNGFAMMWTLSRLGHGGIAAGALVYNTFGVMASLVFAFSVPVSIFTARSFGARNYHEIPAIWQAGAMVVCGIGFIVALGISHLGPAYAFFHQPIEASSIAAQFFHGYAYALIPFGLQLVLSQVMSGVSRPGTSTFFSFLGAICTFPLGLWFALGGWGVHPMGAFGIGVGVAIGYTIVLAINTCYLCISPYFRQFKLFQRGEHSSIEWLRNIFSMGIPITSQRVGEVTAMFAITMIIGHLGQMQLAGYQIAMQFSFVVLMVGFGFTQAGGILVGQSLGAGRKECAVKEGLTSVKISFFIALGCSLVFVLFPQQLIHVFINTGAEHFRETSHLATSMLLIVAISQLFDTLRNVATGALRGYKDTTYPMVLSFISCWGIAVPLAYVFSHFLHLGAIGAMWAFAIGVTLGAGLVLLRLNKLQKLSLSHEGEQAVDMQ